MVAIMNPAIIAKRQISTFFFVALPISPKTEKIVNKATGTNKRAKYIKDTAVGGLEANVDHKAYTRNDPNNPVTKLKIKYALFIFDSF